MKKRVKTILHGLAVLGLLFGIGSGCADNSGLKAQLATAQTQAAMQGQLAAANQQNAVLQQKIKDCQVSSNPTACLNQN